MIVSLIGILLFVVPAAVLAWYLGRRYASWRKRRIVLVAALPLPLLIFVASAGSILYGVAVAAGTCGYDDCGGFILIGIIGIASALAAFVVGLIATVVGVAIARGTPRSERLDTEEIFK